VIDSENSVSGSITALGVISAARGAPLHTVVASMPGMGGSSEAAAVHSGKSQWFAEVEGGGSRIGGARGKVVLAASFVLVIGFYLAFMQACRADQQELARVEDVVRAKGLSGRTAERSGLPNTTDKNKHPQKDIYTIYIPIFASI
jgi:hypothetical protein